jgi:hypothetical protein
VLSNCQSRATIILNRKGQTGFPLTKRRTSTKKRLAKQSSVAEHKPCQVCVDFEKWSQTDSWNQAPKGTARAVERLSLSGLKPA